MTRSLGRNLIAFTALAVFMAVAKCLRPFSKGYWLREDRMNRIARSAAAFAALGFVLWFLFTRLHIVVVVPMPWWGLLITAVLAFLALDWLISKILRG